jgi:hypothetical protein
LQEGSCCGRVGVREESAETYTACVVGAGGRTTTPHRRRRYLHRRFKQVVEMSTDANFVPDESRTEFEAYETNERIALFLEIFHRFRVP